MINNCLKFTEYDYDQKNRSCISFLYGNPTSSHELRIELKGKIVNIYMSDEDIKYMSTNAKEIKQQIMQKLQCCNQTVLKIDDDCKNQYCGGPYVMKKGEALGSLVSNLVKVFAY